MNSHFSKFSYRLRSSFLVKVLVVLLVLAALIGGFFLVRIFTDPYHCRIINGVSIDGVDLSGMTKREAQLALRAAAEETLLAQPMEVILPEETLTIDPDTVKLKLDISAIVRDAYSLGRTQDSSAALNSGLSPYLSWNQEVVFGALLVYTSQYDTALTEPEFHLEGEMPDLTEAGFDPAAACPSLSVTLGTPEYQLDIAHTQVQIMDLYGHGISACRAGNYSLTIAADPAQLPEAVDADTLYDTYAVEAVDAYADLEQQEIIPASYGLIFDKEAARKALEDADYGQTVTIPMTIQIPEYMTDFVPFRDVLGACETRHTNDENRNTNLRLVCEILNGYILQPGEEFSYNGVVGERTKERGFKTATAYSGTRVIQDFGGGVCQGSSTLYNCVLLADLEVTERVCHGYTVGYLPIGLDAAVNWATKTDFKFRNNFNFPIQIQAKLEDGYMKMQILGVDEKDYYIEMRSSRSDEELRIYSNSYKYKYSKETGELLSKDLEARSSYMYMP